MKKRNPPIEGMIKRHPDGFGFLIPTSPDHPDVYIPKHSMTGIMTKDRVLVEVEKENGSDRFRGEIVEVLSRGTKQVVGVLQALNEKFAIIKDEGKAWGEDLKIPAEDWGQAKIGQLVAAEVLTFPDQDEGFIGRVSAVLGDHLDPMTDIKRVLYTNGIPQEFSEATLEEAKAFSEYVSEEDMRGRKDIRNLNFITIDGATAKDFDDAIYVEQHSQGFKLWVAIADVSHYVREGSAIDKDAFERGTSAYFPNFVVPMLPEILSNGLCSLNPHLPRLALVAEMHMNFEGHLNKSLFYEAVIESKARVTYGEAQEIVDGNDIDKLKHVKAEILRAADLAKILMAKRFREGSLDLEIPEVGIILDGAGIPTDLVRSERLFAHRLIEEMMLAANVAVAEFFQERQIPGIYRVHDNPKEDSIALLERYMWNFGEKASLKGDKLQKKLTKALALFHGKPQSHVLNILTLRSMAQAKYSPQNIGHFGLGFQNYTHFTSPIRRYPDLIVHRLVKSLILPNGLYHKIDEDTLTNAATILSGHEQRAVKAERQFQGIKKARFMQKYLGQEFDGVISSVTRFGVFVLLREFEVDGLIRIENLSKDKLHFDEEMMALSNRKAGIRFAIGDTMRVRVAGAQVESGQIDFEWLDSPTPKKVLKEGEAEETTEDSRRSRRRGGEGRSPRDRGGRGRSDEGGRENKRTNREERHAKSGRGSRDENRREKSELREEYNDRPAKRSTPERFERPGRSAPASSSMRGASLSRNNDEKPVRQKSRKAELMDRHDARKNGPSPKIVQVLPGQGEKPKKGFDPDTHLKTALAKWKERTGGQYEKKREDSESRSGHRKGFNPFRGQKPGEEGEERRSGVDRRRGDRRGENERSGREDSRASRGDNDSRRGRPDSDKKSKSPFNRFGKKKKRSR